MKTLSCKDISNIKELYKSTIQQKRFKHHLEILPSYFVDNNMPVMNTRITSISLKQIYNYKDIIKSADSYFKANCYKICQNLTIFK